MMPETIESMKTIDHLQEISSGDQKDVFQLLYDTLLSNDTFDDGYQDEEIFCAEFYPIIVKYAAESSDKSNNIFVKLLVRAVTNSTTEAKTALVKSGALTILQSGLLTNDTELVTEVLKCLTTIAVDVQVAHILVTSGIDFFITNILADFPDKKIVIHALELVKILFLKETTFTHFCPPACLTFIPDLLENYKTEDDIALQFFKIYNSRIAYTFYIEDELKCTFEVSRFIPLFSDYINHVDEQIRKEAFSFYLAIFATTEDKHCLDKLLETSALDYYTNYFQNNPSDQAMYFCRAITNILRCSYNKGRPIVMSSEVLPKMIFYFVEYGTTKTLYDAAYAFCFLVRSFSEIECQRFVEEGCIRAICSALTSRNPLVVFFTLTSVKHVLDISKAYVSEVVNCGGIYTLIDIEGMREWKYELSMESGNILKKYFSDETNDEIPALLPTVDEEKGEFVFNPNIALQDHFHF